MAHTKAQDLDALCATCPSSQEVTSMLQVLGFELIFHMDVVAYPAYAQMPPLPAQYHYRDKHGTEVIYLAGHDADPDGVRLPEHASRFWLYPGTDEKSCEWVAHTLALRWSLTWQPSSQECQEVA